MISVICNNHKMLTGTGIGIGIGLVIVFLLWSLIGYTGSNVEQAKYEVVSNINKIEIRAYPEHIVATTSVNGTRQEALSKGFRIIANYIFGGNESSNTISMTSPVTTLEKNNESIAMTSPVLAKSTNESIAMTSPVLAKSTNESMYEIAFVMPSKYSLETLPVPLDKRVKIVSVPKRKVAAIKFSGFSTEAKIKKYESLLARNLSDNNISYNPEPIYAGYSPPWTPPWMSRNEVMFELN